MARVEIIKSNNYHTLQIGINQFLEKNPTAVPVSHAVVEESGRTQTTKEYTAMILIP